MAIAGLEWLVGTGEMTHRIRVHDWTATALGPIESWPAPLRAALTMVLDHPLPMVLAWGPELVVLHNDAYLPLLGRKADALGRSFLDVWREASDILAPQLAKAYTGEALRFESAPFTLSRGNHPETSPFDYSLSPIRDEAGAVVAILNTAFQTTGRVLAQQRRVEIETAHQDSETRFRALVTAGTYSIYRMSPDWRVMYQLDSKTLANTAGPIENWVENTFQKRICLPCLPQSRMRFAPSRFSNWSIG